MSPCASVSICDSFLQMSGVTHLAARRRSLPPDGPATGTRRVLGERELAPLVLLVDDAAEAREMYAEYLEHAGYRVTQAADGDHALWKVASTLPDVIVMDLAMPILDGWEATRKLRTHPRTKHIPVVVLTGDGSEASTQRAHDAGANVVLVKPCTPDVLDAVIRRMLGG